LFYQHAIAQFPNASVHAVVLPGVRDTVDCHTG
jgi:hypothetical protein